MEFELQAKSFAIGVVASLTATLIVFIIVRTMESCAGLSQFVSPRKVSLAPQLSDRSGRNDRFYKLFTRCLRKARSEVWILGEGPHDDDRNAATVQYALYRKAYTDLLDRAGTKVRVIRIQTTRQIKSKVWKRLLEDLLEEFPRQNGTGGFELYFAATNAAYCAVIDPDDPDRNVAEMMLPTVINGHEIAGFGVFVHDRSWVAQSVRDKLKRLIDSAISVSELVGLITLIEEKHTLAGRSATDIASDIAKTATVRIRTSKELHAYLEIFESEC